MASAPADLAAHKQHLAANIVRMRSARRWTQQEAAEAIGIDMKHLQKLEYGALNPSLRTLVQVATAFNVSVGRLFSKTPRRIVRRPVGRPPRRQRRTTR